MNIEPGSAKESREHSRSALLQHPRTETADDRGLRPDASGAGMSPRRNAPDPEALAKAREIQGRLQPAEVMLLGSRAAGGHRPDSDVDLMAVVPDETAAKDADRILRHLLEGKHEVPVVVNVVTIAREEFRRAVPLAQSQARQASGDWAAMRERSSPLSWVCGTPVTDARGET